MRVFKFLQFILCATILSMVCASCDSTTAEEYKAQAIGYAESGEHQKAAKAYLKAAEKGDAEAQFIVGFLYFSGDKMPNNPFKKDIQVALNWLNKSANQEFGDALTFIGQLYMNGTEVQEDKSKAIDFFNRAVKTDIPIAAYFLGDIYDFGRGVPKDQQMAIQYYKQAYEGGVLIAGLCLSSIYLKCEGSDFLYGVKLGNESFERVKNAGLDPLAPLNVLQYDLANHCKKIKF